MPRRKAHRRHSHYQEVADWLYYLVKERELSASSVNIAVNAVRFLYGVTLERNTDELMASVPRMKHAIRRAEIYARSEVEAILSAPRQPRDTVTKPSHLARVQSSFSKLLLRRYAPWSPSFTPNHRPSLTVLFPCIKQRQG